MIEIEELDHVLGLARDRVEGGSPDEASDYFEQLLERFDPSWVWPETRWTQFCIRTGRPVDWGRVRSELLLAINVSIVRTIQRHESESRGRDNRNADRRDAANDRRDEIRQVYRDGMTAGDVVRALRLAGLGPYPRSTVEKDLKKIRGPAK